MTDEPRSFPYVWVTWITKLLADENRCVWSAWYRAHYKYRKRPRGDEGFLAEWTHKHDAMVQARVQKLKAKQFVVTVEKSNEFKLAGKTALLSGKPDIVARVDDATALVVDEKSGTRRNSDIWQVLVYKFACARTTLKGRAIIGEVEYRDGIARVGDLTPVHVTAITDIMRTLGDHAAPSRTPSARECGKCDVLLCPERVEESRSDGGEAETEEF